MNRIRKVLHLEAKQRRILISAVLLLGGVRLGLWLLPFRTLRRLLAQLAALRIHPQSSDQGDHDYVIRAVLIASRYVPHTTCLTQALAVRTLLLRRDHPAQLRIGVAKRGDGKGLEAHAWVESQGRIVTGGLDIGRYSPLSGVESRGL